MDSLSPNSSQINPSTPSSHPQNPDEMQIENLPSTLDTKETLTNQATTATPLRVSTSSSGENGTVQEPIVIESPQNTPLQTNLVSHKKISKVFIIDDTPEQPQDSSIQIENPKSSPPKDHPVRSAVFPDQPKASSIAADHDSSADEAESAKASEKRSVNKLSFLNKYLSSTSKSPSPVIEENTTTTAAQPEPTSDFVAAADSNLKAISELEPIEESAKETNNNSQKMEIIEAEPAPITTENIVIEQTEVIQEPQVESPAQETSENAQVQVQQQPAAEEEVATRQNAPKENEYHEEPSYNIMDRPPAHEDPYLADSNMLFGFRPQTSPCDPTTSPTKLARYNSLMSQGSDVGKISAGYKFGHGEDSRGVDVRGDLMAMMNAENSMPIDAGIVREEYEEHENEEAEEKTSQKKEVRMTKVERVQTIINGNIVKESPKHSEPDLNNNKEIEAIVESIVSPKQETAQAAQENDHSMAIENEAKYQPSLGEVVELDSQPVPTEREAAGSVTSPAREQLTSPKEGRSSMKKLKEVREEEGDEKIAQEEAVNKFEETAGIPGEAEMSVEIMDEERRKSEAEPLPLRHAKTPNYLERKLQKIQEDNLKSMGDFNFKKSYSKLEKEKMEAKQTEAYKPKAQPQKAQETANNSTFMSDTKQHFSKLQLEKMASKAKEGTQSAMQKTQPRNTSKSPVPQRKVVTPSAIPSRTNTNKPNANAVSPLNRSTASHLKRKFDALKPQNGQNAPQQTAGHEMKKVKLTEDLNISAFSLAESVMVTKENISGHINMQSVQQSGNLTKRVPSVSRVSGGGNGMPKTAKSCVFCGDAFTNKNDTKMMSCLHKAHTNCFVQMERRKKASCPICNSNMSPISSMYAMPKPAAYKF